jgi:putative hydrolase of the HAD superfamily
VPKGLLVDFGGVLTTNVFASFAAFCEAERLDPDTVRRAFMEDDRARGLLFDLELGRLDERSFGTQLGELLGVADTADLAGRLFGHVEPDDAMVDAVRGFRARGVRTGLISNSWGTALYAGAALSELFDALVISGEEGLRKPDPAIYALGAERIGLPPQECVFVDDLGGNLKPARAMGMLTIRHRSAGETIAQLEQALGVSLA